MKNLEAQTNETSETGEVCDVAVVVISKRKPVVCLCQLTLVKLPLNVALEST